MPSLLLTAVVVLAAARQDSGVPVLHPGDVVQGTLADGDPVVHTPTLDARPDGEALGRSYRLEPGDDGPCFVELRSLYFDPYLVLRDESGRLLAEDDDGLVNVQSRIVLPEARGGVLILQACALAGGRGGFELAVRGGVPEALDERERRAASIDDARLSLETRERELGPEHPSVHGALHQLGLLLEREGDVAGARAQFERALTVLERRLGPDHPDVAVALMYVAKLAIQQGDPRGAASLLERVIAIREQALGPDSPLLAEGLSGLSVARHMLGELDEARRLSSRAVEIHEAVSGPDHPNVGLALSNYAAVLRTQGELSAARAAYERALTILERALGSEHSQLAPVLSQLADIAREQADYARARLLLERSLVIRERDLGPWHPAIALTLHSLGSVLATQGDLAASRSFHERALAIRERALGPLNPAVAASLHELANLDRLEGDLDSARKRAERVLAIQEQTIGPDHPALTNSLNHLALLLTMQGDQAGARPLFERSLAIRERSLGPDSPFLANSLQDLAALHESDGDIAGARQLGERALAILEHTLGSDHPDVVEALAGLVRFDRALKDTAALESHLQRLQASLAASGIRLVQRAGETEARDYLRLIAQRTEYVLSPAVWEGQPVLACQALLAWKGQVLRAVRAGRSALHGRLDADSRALVERLHEVTAALSASASSQARGSERTSDSARLAALVEERGRLEREVGARITGVLPPLPEWRELRDALPVGSALVDLFIHRNWEPLGEPSVAATAGRWTEPRLSAWITRRGQDEPVHVDLGAMATIEAALATALRGATGARGVSLQPTVSAGPSLYALLWTPLAAELQDADLVFVSPDGALGTVPFEILRGEDGRYQIEDRGFVYLGDPTDLLRRQQSARAIAGTLLTVGGVDYSAAQPVDAVAANVPRGGRVMQWSVLPATAAEAETVAARHASVFPESDREALTGAAATEERIKSLLPRASVVHLATHGYFDPDGLGSLQSSGPGLLSGLVCAGVNGLTTSDGDDGYLTAEEVGWLDLSGVRLVVLSACDTGLGRPQSGEGLIGLRRAFLAAGARTVVSSLWAVPDQETAELMDSFYDRLWSGRMGAHAALRSAQLELLRRDRERLGDDAGPLSWGAFVLDGDWL